MTMIRMDYAPLTHPTTAMQAPTARHEHSPGRKPWENEDKNNKSLSLWERARVREILNRRMKLIDCHREEVFHVPAALVP